VVMLLRERRGGESEYEGREGQETRQGFHQVILSR
jgi:hypothetical protein